MPALAKKHRPKEPWKPLQPIILRDPLLYRLANDRLLLMSATTNILIDCVRSLYRQHLSGSPKRPKPSKIDGAILIDVAKDFTTLDYRRWELYERICKIGIFIEVSSLEYKIYEVNSDAYDRDDINDWFAFINGHAVPVSYSVQVIIQALQDMQPRVRELAAAALGYLVRHRGHHCYSKSENCALDEACQVLQDVSTRLKDKKLIKVYHDSQKRRSLE